MPVKAAQRQLSQFETLFENLGDVKNGFPEEADLRERANRSEYDPQMLHINLMFGTPDEVITTLKPYREPGVDQFTYDASLGLGFVGQKRSLELFINEVMPAFAQAAREGTNRPEHVEVARSGNIGLPELHHLHSGRSRTSCARSNASHLSRRSRPCARTICRSIV